MEAVADRLERTETVLAADFRGLTVAELAELRQRLREAEAEMAVVKNTLSRRAADKTGRSALVPYLQGPTGLVWVDGDPARAAKALSDFAKAHQDVFSIRGGVLGAEDLPAASIVRLASLPSRDQLLAQLAGAIASPLSGLAGRLNSLVGNLARTLAAVRDSGALAPGEAPAPGGRSGAGGGRGSGCTGRRGPAERRAAGGCRTRRGGRGRDPARRGSRMPRPATRPNRVSKHQRTSPRATPPPMSSPQTTHPPRASPTTPKADQHVPRGVTTRWR